MKRIVVIYMIPYCKLPGFFSKSAFRLFLCTFLLLLFTYADSFAQTEFDSLKRNSMLDTSFQPSQKPTLSTEFADLKISGFIQPAIYFDNNNVFQNDLFVTSEIPTRRIGEKKFKRFHMSANQSRLGFGFSFPKAKRKTAAFLEADFLSSTRGENAFFRLRHAYLQIGEVLIGQTWTNFGDVSAAPNTLDLEGPNSMPASRVTQVRWRKNIDKNWSLLFAIEEPTADYTPLPNAQVLKSAWPNIVVKPKYKFKNGHWAISALLKPIVYTDSTFSFEDRLTAWGLTNSVQFNLKDKKANGVLNKKTINLFAIIGSGTQGSVNDFGGLGFEAYPKDNQSLSTLRYFGGYFSMSAVYRKRWSFTTVYSYLQQQQPVNIQTAFKRSNYFALNGIYTFNKYFNIGSEILFGVKENYNGEQGSAIRFLCVMRMLF